MSRVLLDGLVAVALVLLSVLMVRSIGRIQQRLERHNEELLALHGAGLDVSAELSLDESPSLSADLTTRRLGDSPTRPRASPFQF